MSESDLESHYKQQFTARIKQARIARGLKQWQMGEALGMPQDKYKQYEGRTLLPHHLIGRFCIVTRVDPVWLLFGRGEKALRPLEIAAVSPAATPKKAKRAKKAA